MTSTGPGPATATVTSPTCTVFWLKKPFMGGLVQIKSDTHAAWMGGIPNSDWTDLKISTTDPQQFSQIHPMPNDSSFCEQSKGLDVRFSKEKGDLFSFQCKLLQHFQDMGMDTITYFKNPRDCTNMVNLLMDNTWFAQAYVKTPIKEQHKLYNSYNCSNDCGACYTLLDSLDSTFKTHIKACLPNDFCFQLVWMQVIKAMQSGSLKHFKTMK